MATRSMKCLFSLLLMAASAVAAQVDVGHVAAVASVSASPGEVGASLMMASVVLGVPLAEKVDQGIEVATPLAPTMRAKLQVSMVQEHFHGPEGTKSQETLNLHAVCKSGGYPDDGLDEDNTFAKFSPGAHMSINIANPSLFGKFSPGQKFYVDFTEVPT